MVIKNDSIKVNLNGVKNGEVMFVVIMLVFLGSDLSNGSVNN